MTEANMTDDNDNNQQHPDIGTILILSLLALLLIGIVWVVGWVVVRLYGVIRRLHHGYVPPAR
jgi:hypothetical protein